MWRHYDLINVNTVKKLKKLLNFVLDRNIFGNIVCGKRFLEWIVKHEKKNKWDHKKNSIGWVAPTLRIPIFWTTIPGNYFCYNERKGWENKGPKSFQEKKIERLKVEQKTLGGCNNPLGR